MRKVIRLSVLGLGLASAMAAPASVPRQDSDAVFRLSMAGIPIGQATLDVEKTAESYVLTSTANLRFLFWGGSGGARTEGVATERGLQPVRYALQIGGARPGGVTIDFAEGRAVHWETRPEPQGEWAEGRVEITETHVDDVLDPLSALVIPMPATAEPDAVCQRLLRVFSGFTRFDLELTGAKAAAPEGVACSARYHPVAGHRPDSRGVARMQQPGAFEIALAPLGESLWGPSRVAVDTRFGTFEMRRVE